MPPLFPGLERPWCEGRAMGAIKKPKRTYALPGTIKGVVILGRKLERWMLKMPGQDGTR